MNEPLSEFIWGIKSKTAEQQSQEDKFLKIREDARRKTEKSY